ncbi:MAG: mandelate racemase/muconate lactonizing enzyme family protein [Alphaproteobacteria bacterium]|jgi:L-alanine-DL-glutamate epimerase-like enolase superfamily enzyme|nr:mandelate racemase/muconate lactonizing enzyme family protein [Paracoccaceae bacterium]
MKIETTEAHLISVPLKVKTWTAQESFSEMSCLLIEINTDSGLQGVGQVTGPNLSKVLDYVQEFGAIIKGMDARSSTVIWDKLFSLTSPRPYGANAKDGLPPPLSRTDRLQITAAIGGIDNALWDIKGKAANMPVFRLLGGEKSRIPVYATGGYLKKGAPITACAAELKAFIDQGYTAVKLKVGHHTLEEEVKRVKATREAIGDAMLMLDMNACYDLNECIHFAKAVEPFNLTWLEEPLHWYLQPADFAKLAEATSIPIAHGERLFDRFTARDFIENGGIKFIQFDSTRHSGFTEHLRIAHMAEQNGIFIAPHLAPEMHGHLVSAFPRAGFIAESHGDPDRNPLWHGGLFSKKAEIKEGYLQLNESAGFGYDIDWNFVAKYRVNQ